MYCVINKFRNIKIFFYNIREQINLDLAIKNKDYIYIYFFLKFYFLFFIKLNFILYIYIFFVINSSACTLQMASGILRH